MREEKKGFPYDPAPDVNRFPACRRAGFDLVNEYGTYNIPAHGGHGQPLSADRAGAARAAGRGMKLEKGDLEQLP